MNLYEVVNGWSGESYVRVYVMAATSDRALELARASFRRVSGEDQPLQYSLVCELDGGEIVSKPSDCGWEAWEDETDE